MAAAGVERLPSPGSVLTPFAVAQVANFGFGSHPTLAGVAAAHALALLSGVSGSLNREDWAVRWVRLLMSLCHLSLTACCVGALLTLLNSAHPSDGLIPAAALPAVMPQLVLVALGLLFLSGLEPDKIFDVLSTIFLALSIALYLGLGLYSIAAGSYNFSEMQPFFLEEVLIVSALFKPFIISTKRDIGKKKLWNFIITLGVCFSVMIVKISVKNSECLQVGLVCPFSDSYFWYKPTVSCLALLTLCFMSPQVVSSVLHDASQFKLFRNTKNDRFSVKSILFIGIVSCLLSYILSMEQLLFLQGMVFIIDEGICIFLQIIHCCKKLHLTSNDLPHISKEKCYRKIAQKESLVADIEKDESCNSSDTDIDSIVEEYKEQIKVINGQGNLRVPTIYSHLVVVCSLFLITVLSVLNCYIEQMSSLQFLLVFISMSLLILVIISMPRNEPAKNPFLLLIVYSISVSTFGHLMNIKNCTTVSIWMLMGLLFHLWTKKKRQIGDYSNSHIKLKSFDNPVFQTNVSTIQRKGPMVIT